MTHRLTALTLALAAGASLHALDVEQAQGGLVLGNDTAKEYSFSWHGGLANKQMDQGWARSEDAVFQTGGTLRYWGLGLTLEGAFAVGQDRGAAQLETNDPTTYASREIKPGEMIQLNAKLDYVFQIDGVYGPGQPFLQLIPHVEKITYPNQRANDLKDKQLWTGLDVWLSTPIEGIEIGANSEWNLADSGYRGAFGGREFFQFAPYDIELWQIVNFGDSHYRSNFVDTDLRGWTTSQIGGKVLTPMAWREWWTYVKADWSYWLQSEDRDYRKSQNLDAGDFAFSVGVEWRAE
jgi:hypothetical protein